MQGALRYPRGIVRALRRPLLPLLLLLLATLVPRAARAGDLVVRVLDVGQGDSIFIVSPVGKTVLVDAGPPEAARRLAARLKDLVKGPIDLLLMTHPHADHIGGMEGVVQEIGARIFMEPGFDHPSPIYAQLLRALEAKKVALKVGKAGNNVEIGDGAVMHLLSPKEPFFKGTRSDANANSIVIHLRYKKTSFYLAADSEADTERRILESGEDIASDVYKVAHHGSRHSSTMELLSKIRPRLAVVSVGAGNDYGHPTRQTLDRLEGLPATVLRTDLDGEIVLRSDGEKVSYTTEKGGGHATAEAKALPPAPAKLTPPEPQPERVRDHPGPAKTIEVPTAPGPAPSPGGYVASKNSNVFHRPDCANAGRIKPENMQRFETREAAQAEKRPAKDCNP